MTTPEAIATTAAECAANLRLSAAPAANYELGSLTAALRNANDKLAQYTGSTAKPQSGCHFHTVDWDGAVIVLEYEFEPGQIETWNDPAIPGSVSIIQMLLNGCWIDPDGLIAQDVIDKWGQEIFEAHGDGHQDDYEDARIDDWLERRAEEAA